MTPIWAKTWREHESQPFLEISLPLTSCSRMRTETMAAQEALLKAKQWRRVLESGWILLSSLSEKSYLGEKVQDGQVFLIHTNQVPGCGMHFPKSSQPRKRVLSPRTRAKPTAHRARASSRCPWTIHIGHSSPSQSGATLSTTTKLERPPRPSLETPQTIHLYNPSRGTHRSHPWEVTQNWKNKVVPQIDPRTTFSKHL